MTILNSFPYKNISLQTNHRKEIFQFTQNTTSTHRKTTKIQIAPHLLIQIHFIPNNNKSSKLRYDKLRYYLGPERQKYLLSVSTL